MRQFLFLKYDSPVLDLIVETFVYKWRIIVLNILCNLYEAFSEGFTIAIVYFAIQVFTAGSLSSTNSRAFTYFQHLFPFLESVNYLQPSFVFLTLILLAFMVQLSQSAAKYGNLLTTGYFSATCVTTVNQRVYNQILSFTYPFASSFKVGDLVDYSTQSSDAIHQFVISISTILTNVLLCLTYVTVLALISPYLLIAVFLIACIIFIIQKFLLPRIGRGSELVNQASVASYSYITENIQSLRLIHTFGSLQHSKSILVRYLSDLEFKQRRQWRRLSFISPLSSLLPMFSITLISIAAVFIFKTASTTLLPSLVAFAISLQRLNGRLSDIAVSTNRISSLRGRFSRLSYILSRTNKHFLPEGGVPYTSLTTSIVFDDVSLIYPGQSSPSLVNVSFEIPLGAKYALIGPSGAGKSSIADLLTGLYSPTSGQILIDKINLNEYQLDSWQKRIGVVSQDTLLFNASLYENISYGTIDANPRSISKACDLAYASEFIDSLPQGIHTVVGERGYRLSGGQRQRIALARAILRTPDLLILDEATSALDSKSEMYVQAGFQTFSKRCTSLVIAHRLSTIIDSSCILLIDKGKIIDSGTHSDLLSKSLFYNQLWNAQQSSNR